MPAPSKFTADRKTEILRAKRLGASNQTAARAGGVDPDTLLAWLKRGRASEDGNYADFVRDFDAAEATPNVRALEIVHKAMADKPELAWKFLERKEAGYAPPAPQMPARTAGPVVINLSLTGGTPLPRWADAEVIDAQEVPALGDGGGDAAPTTPPT